MTPNVFLAVLFAAILHALWNALVKSDGDKPLAMTALVLGNIPFALVALVLAPAPARESWSYLAAGVALQVGYQLLLLGAYRAGDLTQVYPIARGTAPILVVAASVLFLGVRLSTLELLGVLVISTGVISISLVRRKDGSRNPRATTLACLTGAFIAAYSIVDGIGARLAGPAIGYYGWIAIGNALVFATLMELARPGLVRDVPRRAKQVFFVGGSTSFVAYSIVVWAFTQAPIALVTALRETSIVFALLIGVFFLGEKLDIVRVFSTLLTMLGAVLLRFSKQ